jgi:hypothetical protein
MEKKEISLVKYAGEFWVTLADFTKTRDTEGYSDHASVKSAVRTFVVRQNPDKYIAFRGEKQIKNIIQENKGNPLFNTGDFQGHTRTAIIHWSMVGGLNERFNLSKDYKKTYQTFKEDAENYISLRVEDNGEQGIVEERSSMIKYLREELQKIDKSVEVMQKNREKIMQALNAVESLELDEL